VAIACGGTGGHLFPGLAVAAKLLQKGSAVMLLVSPKQVDQQSLEGTTGAEILTLPAVGLARGQRLAFLRGFYLSYRAAKRSFQERPPDAALAMGGFTSAAPILAARQCGAHTFLHESNAVPGRANRWLSWIVRQAFIGFPSAAERLRCRSTVLTGTPVRPQIHPRDSGACREALGLNPSRPVVLVMGGSQGASAINKLVVQSLPSLARSNPEWQWIHLTGAVDCDAVKPAYASLNLTAVVRTFMTEMDLALGAATAAISRAGASSLAELAAMRLPAILLPYPKAVDNHQFFNARAFEQSGAARLLLQPTATAEELGRQLRQIVEDSAARQRMEQALVQWDAPAAADQIATAILKALGKDTQSANAGAGTATRTTNTSGERNHCSTPGDAGLAGSPRSGGMAWT
jgi:UDP-N-acetylglucosamine--N-acetylmuramyl-(pentapeptide) pyrophosphoryl-undecaprenol N-acetylglucosamine transferase